MHKGNSKAVSVVLVYLQQFVQFEGLVNVFVCDSMQMHFVDILLQLS